MLTLQEAQAAILTRVRTADRTERVQLARACGRFAAQVLNAVVDNPAFDNSAMDGYALNSRDLASNAGVMPVMGESSCGSAPQELTPGTAMRIFTGAPLPARADTVVMQEDVAREGELTRFPQDTRPGNQVRRRGEDFRAGETLYTPGRRLSAFDLALLSAAGIAEVSVYARPRALVVATGDELVEQPARRVRLVAPGHRAEGRALAAIEAAPNLSRRRGHGAVTSISAPVLAAA